MNEQALQKMQDELMQAMNKEDNLDEFIDVTAKDLAEKMMNGAPVKMEIEGRPLTFKHREYEQKGQKKLFMTVASEFMYQVGKEKYKPYFVDVEINNEMSAQENLTAVVEAFLRHILGAVKAEEL